MENLFEFDGGETTLANLDESSNIANGGFSFVPRVRGERSKVVFPGQNLSGLAQRGEIEGAWDVPSPSDFQRVKRISIGDSV